MINPNTPLERPNFPTSADRKTSDRTPVFTGELRLKAKEVLSTMLTEGRFSRVTEIIQKDPSLALGAIPIKTKGLSSIYHLEFPLACLDNGYVNGCVFAIQHGYPINKILPTGETLLSRAVSHYSKENDGSVIRLLLSMGANPNIPRPDHCMTETNFALVMQHALPVELLDYPLFSNRFHDELVGHTGNPLAAPQRSSITDLVTPLAFLDAKTDIRYSNRLLCPLSLAVLTNGWTDPSLRSQLTQFMTKLAKAGADVDAKSGALLSTPLQISAVRDNMHAILALVRLGAKPEVGGISLIDDMANPFSTLSNHIPAVQSALMERAIAASLASNPPPSSPSATAPSEPRSSRRRMIGL